MLTRTQLKELFTRYHFMPLKRLGANYLIDANIKDKIIAAAGPCLAERLLEIGPGLGALTADLAGSGARVTAVEKDRKAARILQETLGAHLADLTVVQGDILDFDIASFAAGEKILVVGNLPYYITSPIIELIIAHAPLIRRAVFLVQKEFAERLMAAPGSKAYSSLSIFVSYYADVSYIHTVNRTAFYPEPEVDSAIVRFEMRKRPLVEVADEKRFFAIMRGAFNQRRKTVMNSLSREAVLDMPKAELAILLERAGIDPMARPETLSIHDFARLANLL